MASTRRNRLMLEFGKMVSFGASEGMSRGLNWGLMVLLPIILSPEEYGLVGLTIPLIIIGGEIFRLGQSRTILRYYSEESEQALFIYSQLVLWLLVSVISIGFIFLLGLVRPQPIFGLNVFPYLIMTVLAIAGTNLIFLSATVARAEQDIAGYFRFRLGENGFKVVAILSLVYFYPTAQSYLIGFCLGTGIMGIWAFQHLWKRSVPPILKWEKSRKYLLFGLPFVFHMIAANLFNFIGRFQVKTYLGIESVGIFTFATTIGLALTICASVIAIYFEPRIYHQAGNKESSEQWLATFTFSAILFGSLASIVALLVLPNIIQNNYPHGYLRSMSFLPVLFASALLRTLYLQSNYRLALHEKPKLIFIVTLTSLMVHYFLNRWLIPSSGLEGAIQSYFLSVIFLSLSLLIISIVLTPVRFSESKGLPIIILIVLTLLSVTFEPLPNFHFWLFSSTSILSGFGLLRVLRQRIQM